jgi:galactokinase/mevalonate kinase-like predicted kinase
MISVSLPARINIVGSPTDAVEGAYATISAAVDLRGGAMIEAGDGVSFERSPGERWRFHSVPIEDPGGFQLEAAALNALCRYAPGLATAINEHGATVRTWTHIPASSGLGGSSVLILAVLAALRAHYGLDARRYNDYVLAEIAQRAEERDLGVVCGFADRYVAVFGGLAYLSYHGKLWHAELAQEPFVTYERLDPYVPPLRFCVATTGVERDSGSVHAPMRERYLAERRRGGGAVLELARRIGETAWRGKIALLEGDLVAFGRFIDRNQELIEEMMVSCGFASGAGEGARALIAAAREAGALGAKLTGAGGGGAIFALPGPGDEERVADALRQAAQASGLTGSEVSVLAVSPAGLRLAKRGSDALPGD